MSEQGFSWINHSLRAETSTDNDLAVGKSLSRLFVCLFCALRAYYLVGDNDRIRNDQSLREAVARANRNSRAIVNEYKKKKKRKKCAWTFQSIGR